MEGCGVSQGLGELQQLVLLALIRLGDDAYGARISRALLDIAGREVSISTIYITLVRMEEHGLVESTEGEHPGRGGRRRRCFAVTEKGMARLRSTREAANRMWQDLEQDVLGERA
jgi:DNA-binding PadR family transcriptional regulator